MKRPAPLRTYSRYNADFRRYLQRCYNGRHTVYGVVLIVAYPRMFYARQVAWLSVADAEVVDVML